MIGRLDPKKPDVGRQNHKAGSHRESVLRKSPTLTHDYASGSTSWIAFTLEVSSRQPAATIRVIPY